MNKPFPLLTTTCYGRTVREETDLVSDGLSSDNPENGSIIERIKLGVNQESSSCEPLLGFYPCSTNVWGHLFMFIACQYLLAQGQMYVNSATLRLVQIHGPDSILGGKVFQLLLTFPGLIMVLAAGLISTKEGAENTAVMGMQLLVGSAVMMLTLVWGASLAFGSKAFSQAPSHSRFYSFLTENGAVGDLKSRWLARCMLITMIPLVIFQLTKMTNSSSVTRLLVLIDLIVTVSLFICVFAYQVMEPWILKRRFKNFLQIKNARNAFTKALNVEGDMPDKEVILWAFAMADKDHDKMLSIDEMRDFLRVLGLEEYDGFLGIEDLVDKIMNEFDTDGDKRISKEEFNNALSKIIRDEKRAKHKQTFDTSEEKSNLSGGKLAVEYVKACLELLLGFTFLLVLSIPNFMAVMDFSAAANISPMWVPYVVIPLAMNYQTALFFIHMARQKNLMLSKIYEIVCMVNLVSTIAFLALVYIRDLSLDISAEVSVVLTIGIIMGSIANFSQKFPIWISFFAILLYPISLILLYVFTIFFGWT